MRDVLLVLLGSAVGATGSTVGYLIVGRHEAKQRARHDCAVTLRDLVRLLTTITRPESLARQDAQQLDALVLDLILQGTMAGREDLHRASDVQDARDAYLQALSLPTADGARDEIQGAFERLETKTREAFTWTSRRATR